MAYEENPIMNQNKGYAGQEKKDLMNDNPIAKDASGGRGGSWMSKHSQSKMGGSPLMATKPDFADLDGDGDKKEPMKKAAKEADKKAPKKKTDKYAGQAEINAKDLKKLKEK
tara:strand:+ start:170 stop:505 length:336 start_codon:yes stop_codon:yes gene_type:complete